MTQQEDEISAYAWIMKPACDRCGEGMNQHRVEKRNKLILLSGCTPCGYGNVWAMHTREMRRHGD